jgi:ABC-type uncharacterized transport system permease subunit
VSTAAAPPSDPSASPEAPKRHPGTGLPRRGLRRAGRAARGALRAVGRPIAAVVRAVVPAPVRRQLARFGIWASTANQLVIIVLGLTMALVFGGVIIAFSTPQTLHAWRTIGSNPGGSLLAILQMIGDIYRSFFTGAVVDPPQLWHALTTGNGWQQTLTPLSQTLVTAAPLILGGLGVGIGFQTGVFNIGGAGQFTAGAVCAAYVGTNLSLPAPLMILACVLAGIAGGAVVGAIPGILKALTGAHEVIITIMLNYVVGALLIWDLERPWMQLQQPGQSNDVSKVIPGSYQLPHVLSSAPNANVGILIALAAAVIAWWLLDRSTLGFTFRVTGASPSAARNAGMSAKRTTVIVFLISGAFVGLAGMVQLFGNDFFISQVGAQGYQASVGFTAITAALVGRNRPLGITLGALLIAALNTGVTNAEANLGVFPDLSTIILAAMVLCVATPAMVAHLFRLRPGNVVTFNFGGWGG